MIQLYGENRQESAPHREECRLFVLAHAAAAVECRFQSGITGSTMDNAEQMEVRFVDIEIKLAQQEDLVELYCGNGNFSKKGKWS